MRKQKLLTLQPYANIFRKYHLQQNRNYKQHFIKILIQVHYQQLNQIPQLPSIDYYSYERESIQKTNQFSNKQIFKNLHSIQAELSNLEGFFFNLDYSSQYEISNWSLDITKFLMDYKQINFNAKIELENYSQFIRVAFQSIRIKSKEKQIAVLNYLSIIQYISLQFKLEISLQNRIIKLINRMKQQMSSLNFSHILQNQY
ncbi:unnamed protein product [Paramecium sonneborni]|uniref:Uncharacterized protein n=1 Tax=Paramecium sonneborni TaxID=65129 RepID=A0A8S1KR56_9CILI|nr:unnamed protein product [Paramecium sonneborni]